MVNNKPYIKLDSSVQFDGGGHAPTSTPTSTHRRPCTEYTIQATLHLQGQSPTYILNEDTQPVIRAIGVSHIGCKDEFRQNLRSHSWSVYLFLQYIL